MGSGSSIVGLTMLDHRSRRNGSGGFGEPWLELDEKES